MDTELDALNDKVAQLIACCDALKGENHTLRQKVLQLEQRNRQLATKVDGARDRVASLLARLPQEDEA
ncbi:cell division protein ZapB [Chitinibacteraceae bacterium HSL-7]